MTPARKLEQEQEPKVLEENDVPARIRDEHVLVNPDAPKRLRIYRVRDDHAITRAYDKGQLDAGRAKISPWERWQAGLVYRSIFENVHKSNTATSNLNRVSGGSGHDRAGNQIQVARDLLKKINDRLSRDNAQIILGVCGEGRTPKDAVLEGRGDKMKKFVTSALCLALDNLIDALEELGIRRIM